MNNRKIKMISLILVLVMVLTGCATVDGTLTIKSDGSASTKTVVTAEKDALVAVIMSQGYTKTEAENYVINQAITTGAKKTQVDGKDVYQFTETKNYSKNEKSDILSDYERGYITGDTYYDIENLTFDSYELEYYKQYGITETALMNMKINVSVIFDNKIVNTNGQIDSLNPNKVMFTLTMGKKNTLFATTKQGQTIAKVQKFVKASRTLKAPAIKKFKANKVKGKKASITVKIKKVNGAKKYVVEYDTNSKFRNYKTKSTKKTTVTLNKLKKNKKYYIRVYAVKKDDNGNTVFSNYSKKKSIKTKK